MTFDKLKYNQKIEIARLYFRENFYNGENMNLLPKTICINYNNFEFYGKAFDQIQIKIEKVEKFFNTNTKLIRKEKLLQIRKNLS